MSTESYIQWCNENEGRAYPIAEGASQVDVRGNRLPTDILADACIMVPPEYADAYVSSIRVTDELVAVSIACGGAALLNCVVRRASYMPYTAVPLAPLTDDVSGWVVFGNHVTTGAEYYRFDRSTPDQSTLATKALRLVERVPVTRFAMLNGDPQLWIDKLTKVLGGAGIVTYLKPGTTDTIVIELDKDRAGAFVGPCNQDCPAPTICSIAGVSPDANGVLTIRFSGAP